MKTEAVNSKNKDTAYIATVLLFQNVSQMCNAKISGWELVESHTDVSEKHFITKYSNGKMWIKAVSDNECHTYSFGAES